MPKIRLGPSIVGGKLMHLSVTSVDRFDADTPYGCARAWGWHTIDRLRPPDDHTARDTGVQVHGEIDAYQTTGVDALGPIARAGKHLLYSPGPGLLVEHESLGEIAIAGVPFYVRLDVLNERDYWLDNDGEERPLEDAVEVLDWKTTGDIGSKALSSRGLLSTTQMPVYGLWSRTRRDNPHVRLSHAYFGTHKRESLKVSLLATREEIDERVGAISEVVERMKASASAPTGAELDPDYSKCHKTRAGCSYLNVCPRPASLLMTLTRGPGGPSLLPTGDTMPSVLEMLKMKKPADAAPVGTVGLVVPATGAPDPLDSAAVTAAVAKFEGQLAAKNVTVTGPAVQALAPDAPTGSAYITSAAAAASVLPPDAPVSGSTAPKADPIPAETLATMSPAIQQAHAETFSAGSGASAWERGAVGTSSVPAIPVNEADEKTINDLVAKNSKKPRAKKSEPDVTPPAGSITAVDTTPSAPVILIDVAVSGMTVTPFDPYVDALLAGICESCGTFDVRNAPNKDSILAFGAWKGIVRSRVKGSPPPPGVYSFRVGSCEVREEIAWGLQSVPGAVVVRGVK